MSTFSHNTPLIVNAGPGKISRRGLTFRTFILSRHSSVSARSALISDIRERIKADDFPVIESWRDLYRAVRDKPDTIPLARLLWLDFKNAMAKAEAKRKPVR